MTMEQVRAFLDPDEPNYSAAALELGPDAMPYLGELAGGDDPLLASKAVYLAGLIGGDEAQPILNDAVEHADPTVRVSAAASVQNVGDAQALELGRRLLDDEDLGVRKVAVNSAAQIESADVRGALQKQIRSDHDEVIRSLADRLDD
jgi:HEAT repeat protein